MTRTLDLVSLLLLAIFLHRISPREETVDDDIEEVLNDQSQLKDFTFKNQFLIIDNKSSSDQEPMHYYMFNLYAKSNPLSSSEETAENQFIMDMYSYKGASPESPLGETVDLTDMAFDFPREVSLAKSVVTPLKLKNDFHRVELLFSQNDCLALFLFLDVRESTKVIIGPQNNRMRFDFRENPDNNFKSSVDNYWGKSRQKYEAISNEMVGTFDHVYLKVVCPFYSVFGRDDLSFKITKLSESSQSNGEPIISKSNSSE